MKTGIMKSNITMKLFFLFLSMLWGTASLRAQVFLSENFNGNVLPQTWTVEDSGSGACRWMVHPSDLTFPMLGSSFLLVNSDSSGAGTIGNETITGPLTPVDSGNSLFLTFRHFFRKRNNRQDTGRVEVFHNGSWNTVLTLFSTSGSAGNPAQVKIDVSQYAGPEFRVRFRYESLRAWYWAIDDVQLYTPPAADLGIIDILNLNAACGISNPFTVSVKVKNYGSKMQTGFPLSYQAGSQPPVSGIFQDSILPGDTALYTFPTPFAVSGSGTLNFQSWTSLSADSNYSNDSLLRQVQLPPAGFAAVQFTGFTGGNLAQIETGWSEAIGANPQPGSSAWTSPATVQVNFLGSETAKVNLYSSGTKAWILSPVFRVDSGISLKFKIALTNWDSTEPDAMGSDDSVMVKITRNCGQSWETIRSFSAAAPPENLLSDISVSLASFAGESVRIGFLASDGTVDDANDYDIHLDNIRLGFLSPNDLAMTDVILPSGNCGVPASFPVSVRVVNTGSLSQTSLPLNYQVQGQAVVSQNFPVSLSPGADTILTFSTNVSVPVSGNYFISAWSQLAGDANPGDDSVLAVPFSRTSPDFALQGFTGFDGANLSGGWEEAFGTAGSFTPGSVWNSAVSAQVVSLGSETARINLYTTLRKEWIISPAFNPVSGKALRFKLAVTNWGSTEIDSMGSDDSLIVRITTDCGQTWQNLRSYTRNNHLGNQFITENIPLTAFTGQTLRIAFFATDGLVDDANDYDLHLDDIELISLNPNDAGVTALLLPSIECGLPSSLPVKIKVGNLGTQAISGFTVSYSVNGGAPQTEPFSGSLNPAQEQDFQFTVPADFSAAGSYVIRAWTNLAGDQDNSNDSLSSPVLNTTPELLSPVDFLGFDGTNLSTVFPGWTEKTGDIPAGTTSLWNASNASQTAAFGTTTARVGLSGNTRREWIVGPGFKPAAQSELRFRLAVTDRNFSVPDFMGSDDSLKVMISNNCGQTWTLLRAITAQNGLSNALTPYSADLSAFAGQNCQVAFLATDGNIDNLEDYEIHLDNVLTGPLTTSVKMGIQDEARLQVFPNPASGGTIRLVLPEGSAQPRFFSLSGKEYFLPEVKGSRDVFDISSLPAGYYLIRCGNAVSSLIRE